MSKVDKTVILETLYLASWSGVFSLLMQAVFLLVGAWNVTVLLGNLWGVFVMLLNFFLMGLSVQKAVTKTEADAKKVMKLSHSLRSMMVFVLAVLGVVLPCFHTLAVIISLFFPRIAMIFRGFNQGGADAK